MQQLLGLIESIVEDRKLASNEPSHWDPPQPEGTLIDYAGAMKRLGNDADLFREFVGFYDEDSSSLLSEIEAAVDSGDASRLQYSAHSLKGLAANLGASRLASVALSLEEMGRRGSLGNDPGVLSKLRAEMARLDSALDEFRG